MGIVAALAAGCASGASPSLDGRDTASTKPNILFIVMDDVGIDQLAVFGYGGPTPPATPSMVAVAGSGVRFSNTWAMPACSVSRAVLFDGRFPVRTNVYGALGPLDLANSMVSPYEMTAPKLLAKSGYQSALFGKFHLAIQGNNSAGLAMPHSLGWNYFYGWLDETGDPSSIDTTAGGVATDGAWSCGFVRGGAANGADSGACYAPDGTCTELTSSGSIPPGRTCRDQGGILDPNQICQPSPPSYINFDTLNAHYVSPLVINNPDGSVVQVPSTDPRARRFRASSAVDSAVGWINAQPSGKPWMATVSFASAHTPVMQPPVDQEPAGTNSSDLDCKNGADQQLLTDLLIESMDSQIARLLVETGLATRSPTGELVYAPEKTNTMLIIVGDNGTLGSAVKAPFDPTRAKGTAYQTGVWVPLIVAGPLVNTPGRAVSSMVNIADVFQLFGEIAGLDVHETVPRTIDSMSLLPYLSDPNQPSIRSTNFSQIGVNLQVGGALNGPCLFGGRSCSQIPVSKSVCEDNAGTWYGNGSTAAGVPAGGLARCCDVVALLASQGATALPGINPDFSAAVRNDDYKLVQNKTMKYLAGATPPCVETLTNELYAIDEAIPVPVLDKAGSALALTSLTPIQQTNYDALLAALNAQLGVTQCPADGNTDALVNQQDITDSKTFEAPQGWGQSSVYDLNFDGITDSRDEAIILEGMGTTCPSPGSAG